MTGPSMTAGYAVLSAADVALTAFARGRQRELRWLTKPALMPTLGRWATAHHGSGHPVLRRRSLVALGWSAAGDVALLRKDESGFLGGLAAFLGAHVSYVAAFGSARGPGRTGAAAGRVWPAVALWAGAAAVLAPRAGRMRAPVLVYTTAIASMLGSALLMDGVPANARRRIVAGAGCFVVSDGLVGVEKFLLGGSREPASVRNGAVEAVVMASYTLAQWLIADGVVRASRTSS